LIWSYTDSDNITPAGYREGLDQGGDVHRDAGEPLGLDDHLAHVDADANRNFLRCELPLDRDCGEHRSQRAREHAQAAIPEPLDDRPAEGVVVALERTHVPVALVESQALVRLNQRRVPDHVGEHHREDPLYDYPYMSTATISWTAGAIVSSAKDLGTFFTALFDGTLISDMAIEQMTALEPRRTPASTSCPLPWTWFDT